jgi:hypothetical protein
MVSPAAIAMIAMIAMMGVAYIVNLLIIFIYSDRDYGTELLFVEQSHLIVHRVDNCRLH